MINPTALTYTVFELNSALDTGKYDDVSLDEVKGHIEAGDIFDFLDQRLGDNVDLSLLDELARAAVSDGLADICDCYGGMERKKWGVENRGLCLLIAWVNELLQRGAVTDIESVKPDDELQSN